jgi:predicted histone-like DNA-binding protein
MPLTYKVVKCRNPKNPETDYFHGVAVKTGDYDFEDLADDIALATTCTKGDIMAVLASIKPFITKALLNGNRVVLNDLGAFVMGVRGKCYDQNRMKTEEFSPSAMIKGWTLKFQPEVKLKKSLSEGFRLQRVSSEVMP